MASVTIGGEPITVALPNFKTLKAAWSHIAVVQTDTDPIRGVEAILGVVSVGAVGQSLSVDDLEDRLRPAELAGLRPFMNTLLVECGLAAADNAGENGPGEAAPAEAAASPSTATSTPSSPNWSPPDAPLATGT